MGFLRRQFLSRLGAAFSLSATGLWMPRRSFASDLCLSDRIDRLHNNQFSFDQAGKPQISIGLAQSRKSVVLRAARGLVVSPSGPGGTSVRGGSRWRIRLGRATRADERFAVVLANLPPDSPAAVEHVFARWKKRGVETTDHEVGAVFGVRGTVVDTRRILVTTKALPSEAEANRVAERLRQSHKIPGPLHSHLVSRAKGTMIAEDLEHGITVSAESALWFDSAQDDPISVVTADAGDPARSEAVAPRYRGQVYVAIDRTGMLSIVNLLDESAVLAGLVPAEMFAGAPKEALKAQAIAARGQLLARIGTRHRDDPFLLCAEEHCQVYAGMLREHVRSTAAVRETAGRVLMRPTSVRMANTVYSANSGGHTEDNEAVWPSTADPILRGRPDRLIRAPYAGGIRPDNLSDWLLFGPPAYARLSEGWMGKAYRWRVEIDPAAVAGNPGVPADLGSLQRIDVVQRGRSGRATEVRLHGSRGQARVQGELSIRKALGGLRSSMFIVLPDRDRYGRFQLAGGGHGHGVGMCQHGAIGMARAGLDADAILGHYYRGARLATLW